MKTTLKQIGIILLVSGFFALIANILNPGRIPWVQDWSHQVEQKAQEEEVSVVSVTAARNKFAEQGAVFVDARSADEYASGHIPGAVSVPFEELDSFFPVVLELIDSGRELVVYCSSSECDDGLLLSGELKQMGCSNVLLFVGGFDSWQEHGGAVE